MFPQPSESTNYVESPQAVESEQQRPLLNTSPDMSPPNILDSSTFRGEGSPIDLTAPQLSGGSGDLYGGSGADIIETKLARDYLVYEKKDGSLKTKIIHPAFENQDGFMIYYDPSCGHCRDFKPTALELAHRIKGAFQIGAVNCADQLAGNHILQDLMDIQGYPTIKFLDSKSGQYIDYTGGRSLTDLLTFLCRVRKVCNL